MTPVGGDDGHAATRRLALIAIDPVAGKDRNEMLRSELLALAMADTAIMVVNVSPETGTWGKQGGVLSL